MSSLYFEILLLCIRLSPDEFLLFLNCPSLSFFFKVLAQCEDLHSSLLKQMISSQSAGNCSFSFSNNNLRWSDWPQTCKLAASAVTQTNLSNWITSEVSFTSEVGFMRQTPFKIWDSHSYVLDIFISWWITGIPENLLKMDAGIYGCCC